MAPVSQGVPPPHQHMAALKGHFPQIMIISVYLRPPQLVY